jgi:hypothetical protein
VTYDRTSRFRPPRKGFGDPKVEAAAAKWTAELESTYGHDLSDWKDRSKTSRDYGWVSKCVKCGQKFSIEFNRGNESYAIFVDKGAGVCMVAENPSIYPDEMSTQGYCNPAPKELMRGLYIQVDDPEAILAKSESEVAQTLLKIVTSRGLGASWTHPDNRNVVERYSGKGTTWRVQGIPTILHAQFWISDQRRNYKPAGFVTLVEWAHEDEIYLAKQEIVRIQAIEWWDGERWIKQSIPETKAKTASDSTLDRQPSVTYSYDRTAGK